jgi:hypothetical protein
MVSLPRVRTLLERRATDIVRPIISARGVRRFRLDSANNDDVGCGCVSPRQHQCGQRAHARESQSSSSSIRGWYRERFLARRTPWDKGRLIHRCAKRSFFRDGDFAPHQLSTRRFQSRQRHASIATQLGHAPAMGWRSISRRRRLLPICCQDAVAATRSLTENARCLCPS